MPRFVILEHDFPTLHWDVMLEAGDALRTWRLNRAPFPSRDIGAERIADHRLMYLDYQGAISGNRGVVSRWDSGTFELIRETADEIVVAMHGDRVCGDAVFQMTATRCWLFRLSAGGAA